MRSSLLRSLARFARYLRSREAARSEFSQNFRIQCRFGEPLVAMRFGCSRVSNATRADVDSANLELDLLAFRKNEGGTWRKRFVGSRIRCLFPKLLDCSQDLVAQCLKSPVRTRFLRLLLTNRLCLRFRCEKYPCGFNFDAEAAKNARCCRRLGTRF